MNSIFTSLRQRDALKRGVCSLLSATLTLAVVSPSFAGHSHKSNASASGIPGIQSIALFSATSEAGTDGSVAASNLDSVLKTSLVNSGTYEVTSYSSRLPSIDRALNVDNTLTSADVQQPISDPAAALKIAKVMGTDGYILDEVDAYQQDPTTHAITVTVSGNLYFTSTGASARTFAVTGSATPTSPDEGEGLVMQQAVQSAASQILITLNAASGKSEAEAPQRTGHQFHAGSALLIVLTGVMIGFIAHTTNSHPSPVSTNTSSS